ncbi:hypothetical protein [Bacillus cereus group sp. BfR-BA-01380]|uniref:SunI/YnzG family protein n=1 Tax=Bacillus cereus group sp. BfR-BA-01380 TaxID=2920324 RepID=UPI001F5AB1CA|nr:hypothetical protein [Bacillus cereus group sp. BfR-BA-01380]
MLGIKVTKTDEELMIEWQLAKVCIPLKEIIEVTEDDTYGGEEASAIRIGTPYGTTDRILIRTTKQKYLLFTTNKTSILNAIHSA